MVLPAGLPGGAQLVTVTGTETGTSVWIPVDLAKTDSKISANAKPKKVIAKVTKPTVFVTVKSGGQPATGKVELKVAGHTYKATLKKGKAEVKLPAFKKAGEKQVQIKYLGNDSSKSATASVTITVTKK